MNVKMKSKCIKKDKEFNLIENDGTAVYMYVENHLPAVIFLASSPIVLCMFVEELHMLYKTFLRKITMYPSYKSP